MAVKASATITLSFMVDVNGTWRYYKLQASTASAPSVPTTATPSGWTLAEPTYTEGSTNTLYFVDKTVFTDNSFVYSMVSKSSSYEAAKAAYSKAVAATNTASSAQSTANNASSTADRAISFATNSENLCKLDESTATYYGCTYDNTADGKWFFPTVRRDNYFSSFFTCKEGDRFSVECEVSSSVQADLDNSSAVEIGYVNIGFGLHFVNGAGSNISWSVKCTPSSSNAPVKKLSGIITAPANTNRARVFFQLAGWSDFSGTCKIRRMSITKVDEEAAKTATNYMSFSSGTGLVVGDMTADTLGDNVQIVSNAVNIRDGSTVLSSFGANTVRLGKSNSEHIDITSSGMTLYDNTTSLASFDSSSIVMGKTNARNVQIVSDSVNIRDGSKTIASFEPDKIALGLDATFDASLIELFNGKGQIGCNYEQGLSIQYPLSVRANYGDLWLESGTGYAVNLKGSDYGVSNPDKFRSAISAASSSHTHNYAGSSSAGGAANLVKYTHTNEINFSGGAQSTCWFNYRNADTDASATSAAITYKFGNYTSSTANSTVEAGTFKGNLTGNCSGSAGSVAWGNVSGKPSTFAPSSHTHNYQTPLTTQTWDVVDQSIGAGTTVSGNISVAKSGYTALAVAGWTVGTGTGNSLLSVPRLYISGNRLYYLVRNIGGGTYNCDLNVTILYG